MLFCTNVKACRDIAAANAEEVFSGSGKQSESMEVCAGRVLPSDGVSGEFGRAAESAFQRPDREHTAQQFPRFGGKAALQAHTGSGHGAGETQREDVSALMDDDTTPHRLDTMKHDCCVCSSSFVL